MPLHVGCGPARLCTPPLLLQELHACCHLGDENAFDVNLRDSPSVPHREAAQQQLQQHLAAAGLEVVVQCTLGEDVEVSLPIIGER